MLCVDYTNEPGMNVYNRYHTNKHVARCVYAQNVLSHLVRFKHRRGDRVIHEQIPHRNAGGGAQVVIVIHLYLSRLKTRFPNSKRPTCHIHI